MKKTSLILAFSGLLTACGAGKTGDEKVNVTSGKTLVCAGSYSIAGEGSRTPPPSGCTNIQGNLNIGEGTTDSQLDDLRQLKNVGGYIYITHTQAQSFDALSKLETVGGLITIQQNPILQNITLPNLTKTAGLHILSNPVLISSDFGLLTQVTGEINIQKNPQLEAIGGFNQLVGSVTSINISNNDALQNVSTFNNVSRVEADLNVVDNPALTQLNSFNKLQQVGGNVQVTRNNKLENFSSGFQRLQETNEITFMENDNLTYLPSFAFMYHGNNINIVGNKNLVNLDGLKGISQVNGSLHIIDNPSLIDLTGLNNLARVNGSLVLSNNLEGINGLQKLRTVSQGLLIDEPSLLSLSGFDSLESVNRLILNVSPENISSDIVDTIKSSYENPKYSEYNSQVDSETICFGSYVANPWRMEVSVSAYSQEYDSLSDLTECRIITGGLFVHTFPRSALSTIEAPYFQPLNSLKEIWGDNSLLLTFNDDRPDQIDAFSNLWMIGGNLALGGDISGIGSFDTLEHLGGNLLIENVSSFEGMPSFNGLK